MGFTRIDTQDVSGSAITPSRADLSGSSIWSFQGGLSGSLQRTSAGASYLVAGTNITITSASNGQITVAAAGGALTSANFVWNEVLTGSDGSNTSFSLVGTPSPGTSLRVHKNGLRMLTGTLNDYVLSGSGGGSGRTVIFNAGAVPTLSSSIVVDYMV